LTKDNVTVVYDEINEMTQKGVSATIVAHGTRIAQIPHHYSLTDSRLHYIEAILDLRIEDWDVKYCGD
jgi:hypothetical protein